ncbi:unnamed protein product, partial [marine sediment metagenome]
QTNIEISGGILDGNQANQAGGLHAHIIEFDGVTDALIQNIKTINSSYDHIILTGSTENILIDNWIGDGGRDDGFNPLVASDAIIMNSTARNMTADGFHLSTGSLQISVIGCISHDNDNGISINNSQNNIVSDNIIYDNAAVGIYLSGVDVSYNKILDNLIYGNAARGIYYATPTTADYITISGNTIQGGTDGIRIENAISNTVTENIIEDVANSGIVFIGGASYGYHVITDNIIDGAGDGNGIYIDNVYSTISHNIIVAVWDRSIREAAGADFNFIEHNTLTAGLGTAVFVNIVGADTKLQWMFMPISDPNTSVGDHPGVDLPDDTDTNVY